MRDACFTYPTTIFRFTIGFKLFFESCFFGSIDSISLILHLLSLLGRSLRLLDDRRYGKSSKQQLDPCSSLIRATFHLRSTVFSVPLSSAMITIKVSPTCSLCYKQKSCSFLHYPLLRFILTKIAFTA